MLFVIRFFMVLIFFILICLFGMIYCLFSPKNPCHVATFSHAFGRLSTLFGLKVEVRMPPDAERYGNCIYIANHQNNYDMVTVANAVQPGTVTVGKKSLVWIPFFGPLYWLAGNLLIDRKNFSKAHGAIAQIVQQIKERNISVWMFPEGTRSRGRGLMPFKTGAFHAAISARVPIFPICVSNTHNKVRLNRWDNGHVIVEMMPPIDTSSYSKEQVRELAAHCHVMMAERLVELDAEVADRKKSAKH
ncbi:MAG: 1-acylglycerol-3-phosphate O-acyltransferase [Candidatus Malihini olakiniferum]